MVLAALIAGALMFVAGAIQGVLLSPNADAAHRVTR